MGNEINPKALAFIDQGTPDDTSMHPDAHQFIDKEQAQALTDNLSQPRMSATDAAMTGLGEGGTLGFAPRIGAALGAGLEEVAGNPDKKSLEALYNEYLEYNNKRRDQAAKERPEAYYPAALAGGLALPIPAPLKLAKNENALVQLLKEMKQGATTGAQVGAVTGLSHSPDLTSPKQDVENMGIGMGIGATVGIAAPPVIGGIKTLAKGTKELGSKIIGDVGGAFTEGKNAGYEGLPNLATSEGRDQSVQMRGEFANQFGTNLVDQLNGLGTLKNKIIKEASDRGLKIDPKQIDEFISKHLANDPQTNLPKVMSEMAEFHEILKTAQEGPEVEKVTRKFFGEGNTQKEKFLQKAALTDASQEAAQAPEEFTPLSPRDEFELKARQKQAEQQAIAGAQSPVPHELSYEPIPDDPNNELGIVKQPQFDDMGNFSGHKKIMSQVLPKAGAIEAPKNEIIFQPSDIPNKVFAIQRQPQMDESGNIVGYKILNKQLVNDTDAAKWKDMTETVRAGGRDLSDPEQLYRLYKDLKEKSKFADSGGFSSTEAQKATGGAMKDIQGLLRGSDVLPELQPMDGKITALNKVGEILGIDTRDLNEQSATKKILDLINNESNLQTSGITARQKIDAVTEQLRQVDPKMADEFQQQIEQHSVNKDMIKEITKPFNQLTLSSVLGAPRAFGTQGATAAGYKVGQFQKNAEDVISKVTQSAPVQRATTFMDRYTPQVLQGAAAKAASSSEEGMQGLARVLTQAASLDDRSRNAIVFGVMQNPAYRQWMEKEMGIKSPVGE